MRILPILFIGLLIYSCKPYEKQIQSPIEINTEIPIYLGIHNDYPQKDSFHIELIDNWQTVAFEHKGPTGWWAMINTNKKIKSGEYLLRISWLEDLSWKQINKKVFLESDVRLITLNIELSNTFNHHNGVYLDKYYDNKKNLELIREWDPQVQFEGDTSLLPSYRIMNQSNDTIYGKYLRFSSSLSINWVQPHNIAFLSLEKFNNNEWQRKGCNAPRIEMNLKPGEQGKTLEDMRLDCPVDSFEIGKKYRIGIDYMVNDITREEIEKNDNTEDYIFVGQKIYTIWDEFILK